MCVCVERVRRVSWSESAAWDQCMWCVCLNECECECGLCVCTCARKALRRVAVAVGVVLVAVAAARWRQRNSGQYFSVGGEAVCVETQTRTVEARRVLLHRASWTRLPSYVLLFDNSKHFGFLFENWYLHVGFHMVELSINCSSHREYCSCAVAFKLTLIIGRNDNLMMSLDTNSLYTLMSWKVCQTTVRNVVCGCHLKDTELASVEEKMFLFAQSYSVHSTSLQCNTAGDSGLISSPQLTSQSRCSISGKKPLQWLFHLLAPYSTNSNFVREFSEPTDHKEATASRMISWLSVCVYACWWSVI